MNYSRAISFFVILLLLISISPMWSFAAVGNNHNSSVFVASAKKTTKKVKKVVKKKVKKVIKKKVKKVIKPKTPASTQVKAAVKINGLTLSATQIKELETTYGVDLQAGDFWYDTRSGAYGKMADGMITFIRAGHSLGMMSADVSGGATGVYINDRQLPQREVDAYASLLGPVMPGQYWLDGTTGNFGVEGLETVLGNLSASIAQATSKNSSTSYSNGLLDAGGGSSGGCSYFTFGSGSSYSDVSVGC